MYERCACTCVHVCARERKINNVIMYVRETGRRRWRILREQSKKKGRSIGEVATSSLSSGSIESASIVE